MNEKLLNISKIFGNEDNEFYILVHKKHKREIYFRDNKKAIEFIKRKFHHNKLIFLLIKTNLLKLFLKKVKLSRKLGDVIFIANEIKCFNLDKKIVISFPYHLSNECFIKEKKFQIKLSKRYLAPEIFKLDESIPFSEEELLEEYNGDFRIPLKKLGLLHKDLFNKEGLLIKEHILKKGDSGVFIDWSVHKK